jgi:DNA-binding XRE family transcriptional regulator
MPSDTIETGLREYSIGAKLRRMRLRKSMGLVQLAAHTGLSPALLSNLEREVMHPTLPTLLRISMVFGWGSSTFSTPSPSPYSAWCAPATASASRGAPARRV